MKVSIVLYSEFLIIFGFFHIHTFIYFIYINIYIYTFIYIIYIIYIYIYLFIVSHGLQSSGKCYPMVRASAP